MTTQYDALFDQAGKTHNVDPALLRAIAKQESGFDPSAVSPVGAEGMMQIMPATARRLGVKDAKDPAQAIDGAARLLSEAMDRNGNVEDAITEYHGGPDRKLWGPKTRKYRAEVLAAYQGGGDQPAAGGSVDDILFGDNTPKAAEAKSPVDDILFGDAPPEQASLTGGITPYAGMKETLPPEQQKTYETLVKAGMLGDADEAGSARKPFFMQSEGDVKGLDPGAYYVDRAGQLARAPGGDPDHSFGKGFGQGLADIPLSVSKMLPGTGDSELGNVLDAKQMIYDADHKGDLMSGAGRFTGQLVGSALPLGAAEAAVAPVAAASGVGRFLIGQGGKAMAPGLARLATRGASLAAEGAAQGAGGAALVSSASDAPLSDQIAMGAAGGALLGPVLPAAVGAGRKVGETAKALIEPLTEQGRGNIANRIIQKFGDGAPLVPNAEELIPGSVPTLAQSTANPGVATLERTVRLGRPTPFTERANANAEARNLVLDAARGDEHTVADLVNTRQGLVDNARSTAFQGAANVDSPSVVSALDDALAAPAAHMDEVSRPLQQLRDKLVQPPADTTPAEAAAFNRAVGQTFGADADALTPEVMSQARSALGKKFEDIAANTEVKWDDNLRQAIGQVIENTSQVVPEGQLPPLFKTLQNIADTGMKEGREGTVSGASYQALTKKGSPLDSLMQSGDPTIRNAASQIREALDDALERSLSASGGKPTGADAYIARINPKGVRVEEGERPNLGMGDMFGMAPKDAKPIATKTVEDLGKVRFVEKDGNVYAIAHNPDLGEDDVVGYAMQHGNNTELHVVNEAQGKGIGSELSYQFRKRNPDAPSGGLSEGGEAAARKAYDRMAAEGIVGPDGAPLAKPTLSAVEKAAESAGVSMRVSEGNGGITLSKIVVPKDQRGQGIGSEAMQKLLDYADATGQRVMLTPSADFGGSKSRLTQFYGDMGFKPNTGRSRDLTVNESMIREPSMVAAPPASPGAPAAGPSALEDLRATRLAYKNLKTVEAALRSAGTDKQVTPQAVLSAVKRNFGQFAYKGGGPLGDAAESAVNAQAARPHQVEARADQVYGMRQGLTDAIDKLEAKDTDAAREGANHLRSVRDHVDAAINGAAPGYADFLEVSTRSAEPVEAQKFLQGLKLTDMNGKITLGRVDAAMDRIAKGRAATGKNPAKSITDATLSQLERLRADLQREGNSNLGRPMGSDTAQHLVTDGISSKLDGPLGVGAALGALSSHPLVGAAVGAGKLFYGMKDKEVMDALASKLLQPELAQPVRAAPKQSGRAGKIAGAAIRPALPVVASRLLGQ